MKDVNAQADSNLENIGNIQKVSIPFIAYIIGIYGTVNITEHCFVRFNTAHWYPLHYMQSEKM